MQVSIVSRVTKNGDVLKGSINQDFFKGDGNIALYRAQQLHALDYAWLTMNPVDELFGRDKPASLVGVSYKVLAAARDGHNQNETDRLIYAADESPQYELEVVESVISLFFRRNGTHPFVAVELDSKVRDVLQEYDYRTELRRDSEAGKTTITHWVGPLEFKTSVQISRS
jgi:ribosomal protein L25 (general stress protein Ctc)